MAEVKRYYPSVGLENDCPNKLDVSHFELDTSKLKVLIGEYSFVSFVEGLSQTYKWIENQFKSHVDLKI
jgi:hypothetical protein